MSKWDKCHARGDIDILEISGEYDIHVGDQWIMGCTLADLGDIGRMCEQKVQDEAVKEKK